MRSHFVLLLLSLLFSLFILNNAKPIEKEDKAVETAEEDADIERDSKENAAKKDILEEPSEEKNDNEKEDKKTTIERKNKESRYQEEEGEKNEKKAEEDDTSDEETSDAKTNTEGANDSEMQTPSVEEDDSSNTSEKKHKVKGSGNQEISEKADKDEEDDSQEDELDGSEKKDDVPDTKDNIKDKQPNELNLNKKRKHEIGSLAKRHGGGGYGGYGHQNQNEGYEAGHHGGHECGCHEGQECCHEGEHGHHQHGQEGHEHNHHDHGYEFYEEWGEHGGHEGGHHGHDECCHEGDCCHEHDCCHGQHHGHGSHEHQGHEGWSKDTVPKQGKAIMESKSSDSQGVPSNTKKWWMVGEHWGGRGHEHWGPPVAHHEGGGWQYGHHGLNDHGDHGSHRTKSNIPGCCKSKDAKLRKKCNCDHPDHHEGYHFHDNGPGHNDEDHNLKGPWSFGYDQFGDDWPDWDHNHHNYEHLQHLEHLDHGDGEESHHESCEGRSCLPEVVPVAYGIPVPVSMVAAPAPNIVHPLPYRVCHDCHALPDGGSRCLCKAVRHHHHNIGILHPGAGVPLHNLGDQSQDAVVEHHGVGGQHHDTGFHHHVYVDCDSVQHKHPHHRLCHSRAEVPTPASDTPAEGKPKQGVVYPYVGYGPWSAYPWWGDWWGGHGNHGWGEGGHGCEKEHSCHHNNHLEGGHHNGALLVEHGGHHGGHYGHEVGFSFGGGGHLNTYHCHDTVESATSGDAATKSKRFCVPIGYHGGYGWPYWHGYPGVGTGLYGWGWPWIKNKVPGSKNKPKSNAETKSDKSKKSIIEEQLPKMTKKQTIHVGYGYASGDNYRLGYGYGGMGGVTGFVPQSRGLVGSGPLSRSTIPKNHKNESFRKTYIPTPEIEKTVAGSKRNIDILQSTSRKQNDHTH